MEIAGEALVPPLLLALIVGTVAFVKKLVSSLINEKFDSLEKEHREMKAAVKKVESELQTHSEELAAQAVRNETQRGLLQEIRETLKEVDRKLERDVVRRG